MSKKPNTAGPTAEDIRARLTKQQVALKSLEAAEAEVFDDLMVAPDDADKVAAMRSAANSVTDAKEHLARLGQSLSRATVREEAALAETQARIRQENLAGIAAQRRVMVRQALEMSVRFDRFVDEWGRFLASADRVRGLLLDEHKTIGGAHTFLMPLKLRTLVERELYRLGGTGNAAQVMNDGALRNLGAPGCAPPSGLSMIEKSAPSTVQSLESRIDQLFASILGEPARTALRASPVAAIIPTSPKASEPQIAPTEGFSAGYEAELARMRGIAPVEPVRAVEETPVEDSPEFAAALEELQRETLAALGEEH